MKRIKRWLRERYLPALARQELLNEVQGYRDALAAQKAENAALNAYIEGMERALRLMGRRVRAKEDGNAVQ